MSLPRLLPPWPLLATPVLHDHLRLHLHSWGGRAAARLPLAAVSTSCSNSSTSCSFLWQQYFMQQQQYSCMQQQYHLTLRSRFHPSKKCGLCKSSPCRRAPCTASASSSAQCSTRRTVPGSSPHPLIRWLLKKLSVHAFHAKPTKKDGKWVHDLSLIHI